MINDIPPLSSFTDQKHKIEIYRDLSLPIDEDIINNGYDLENFKIDSNHVIVKDGSRTEKLTLVPSIIRPARTDGPIFTYTPKEIQEDSELWIVVSDYQCPYYNKPAHEELLNLIARNKPDHLVANGDIIDLPTLSTYPPNPRHDKEVNVGIDTTYQVLRELAEAAGEHCQKYMIPGNHEQRLYKYLNRNASEIRDIRRAGEDKSVLSLEYLLRLDELNYKWISGQYSDWPEATLWVTPDLAIKHGWFSKSGSGNTVRSAVKESGVSLVLGHIHRAAKYYVYEYLAKRRLYGIEGGTMCDIEGGLAYATSPDWQTAIVAIRVFKNGDHFADPVEFLNGRFLCNSLL